MLITLLLLSITITYESKLKIISSEYSVHSGCYIIYDHDFYSGQSLYLCQDVSNLKDINWGDKIASLEDMQHLT